MSAFQTWCESVRRRYQAEFNVVPRGAPKVPWCTKVTERMLRVEMEVRHFPGEDWDNQEFLAIVAHHTILLDDVKNKWPSYQGAT